MLFFELRAIDDDGLRTDPPARLAVPLRNSPPECRIDPLLAPPETTLVAITISLRLSDPDGLETIDSLYVRIGPTGEWVRLLPRHTLLTFVPQNPSASSPTLVYSGNNLNPLLTLPTPLPLDDTLRIYVRIKDQGGLFSASDSTRPIYLRRKRAEWLVLSSWRLEDPVSQLENDLRQAWGSYDYWSLASPTQRPPLRIPTWLHILRAYPKVFWLGSVADLEELEEAEALIEKYLNGGGKLLANFPLRGAMEPTSPIFRWAPIDSISTGERNGLLPPNGIVEPVIPGFPPLTNGRRTEDGIPLYISDINPPYPKSTAVKLYEMPALERGNGQPWLSTQSRAAAVAFPIGAGRFRQIFFIIPLHQLEGDRGSFFSAVQNAFQS